VRVTAQLQDAARDLGHHVAVAMEHTLKYLGHVRVVVDAARLAHACEVLEAVHVVRAHAGHVRRVGEAVRQVPELDHATRELNLQLAMQELGAPHERLGCGVRALHELLQRDGAQRLLRP
jgi:hypothetical protein